MEYTNPSWFIRGGPAYGAPVSSSTVHCWSSVQLANTEASTETVNEQYFRADLMGAGFTGAGTLALTFCHAIMNSAGQSSGSIYGYRSRIDNTAGTLTAGTAYEAKLGSNAETVTAFTGLSVVAPSNAGTLASYAGVSVGNPAGTVTAAYGLSSAIAAGSGLYNLYCSGTARNYLAGKTSFGADVDGEMYVTSEDGYAIKDGMTAPAALAGYAKIYIDSGTGDLTIKYGDGVTKTIVADT